MARRVWPAGQRLGGFKDASPRPLPVGRAGSAAEWRLGVDFGWSASERRREERGHGRPARSPPEVTVYAAAALAAAIRPVSGLVRGRMSGSIRLHAPAIEAWASATRVAPPCAAVMAARAIMAR